MYQGTRWNLGVLYELCRGPTIYLMPFALIDLPFEIAADTVALPYDGYVACQNKRARAFWEQAFDSGVIPPSKSAAAYFGKGWWLDEFICKRISGTPPPSKEVIDCLIDLSFKHIRSSDYDPYPVAFNLARHQSLSAEQIARLYWLEADSLQKAAMFDRSPVLDALLNLPAVTDAFVSEIGLSTNEAALLPLLQSERAPLSLKANLLSRLADSPSWRVRAAVAKNTGATPEQLVRLASDCREDVRLCVAANPNAPADVLEKMALSGYSRFRLAVAKNKNASAGALWVLAQRGDRLDRREVMRHPNATPEIKAYIQERGEGER